MTCGGERTNESDERHVYLQQICGACISRKLMTCIQSALFRHVAARRGRKATARQNAGHYGKWPNWANASEQPPARLRGGLRQVTPSSREVRTPLRTTASHDRDRLEASKKGTRPVTAGAPKVICQLALTTVLRCCASPVPLRQPFCQNYPYIWSWQVRAMTSSCCSRVRSMNFTA